MTVLGVAFGGFLGAVARYGVSGWVQTRTDPGFPWGTLAVNLTGAFALGLVHGLWGTQAARPLTTGVLGAYTTFSTWTVETVSLARDGAAGRRRAMVNVAMSLVVGLTAAAIGIAIGRAIDGGR